MGENKLLPSSTLSILFGVSALAECEVNAPEVRITVRTSDGYLVKNIPVIDIVAAKVLELNANDRTITPFPGWTRCTDYQTSNLSPPGGGAHWYGRSIEIPVLVLYHLRWLNIQ